MEEQYWIEMYDAVNVIAFEDEAAEEAEQEGPSPSKIVLPSTTKHDKKSVEDLNLTEQGENLKSKLRSMLCE